MAPKIDPDDLIDAEGVADLLGLSRRGAVSVYRTRYPDFPAPIINMGHGRCLLWRRADIKRWATVTGRRPGPKRPTG